MIFCHYLLRSLNCHKKLLCRQDLAQWGSIEEQRIYHALYSEKRRREWLVGRLTAKELIQRYWQQRYSETLVFADIEILNYTSGKPYWRMRSPIADKLPDSLGLSISHRHLISLCALKELGPGENMGIDLEYIEPRPQLFAETFCSPEECHQLSAYKGANYDKALTAIWSLKEAALKALGKGLRLDTRKVTVTLGPPPWNRWQHQKIAVNLATVEQTNAWMRCIGNYVLAWVWIKKSQQVGIRN